MLTQEDNLLLQSLYSTMLLAELSKSDFLKSDFFERMAFTYPAMKGELRKVGVDNQGCALMSLYAMLVIPRERFKDQFPDEYRAVEDFLQVHAVNTVTTYKKDSPKINFLRHVRNAVAHARISFRPSEAICFSDEKMGTGEKFSTDLPLAQFGVFLNELLQVHVAFVKRRLE